MKNSGPRNPSVTAKSCFASRRGFADSRDGQAERESGQHDGNVGMHRQCGQREEDREIDPKLQSELAGFGDPVQTVTPAAPVDLSQDQEDPSRTGQDGERAERSPSSVLRVNRERQSDDADRIRHGDLGQRLQHVGSLQPQRIRYRQHQSGRRRRNEYRIHRGMPGMKD